jgi:hypothetical protein
VFEAADRELEETEKPHLWQNEAPSMTFTPQIEQNILMMNLSQI